METIFLVMKTKICWWEPLWTTLDHFGQSWTTFDFDENPFFKWKQILIGENYFGRLWPSFFDEYHFGLLWTTLDHFVWWKQKLTDYFFAPNQLFSDERIQNHFGQLWTTLTSLQILIKNKKFSSMTTTLPANSNQIFVGVGENVNY